MTSPFDSNYKRLNDAQKRAVDTIEGPVMVVAGPGTGKTQILALRIANILKLTDARPENILCLTFTESGVAAMRERLREFIDVDSYKVDIFTFHGFANDVIQRNPEAFEFGPQARQLDDLQRLKIIQDIIEQLEDPNKEQELIPFYDKYAKQWPIITAIQTLKKEGIGPEELKVKATNQLTEHEENIIEYKGKPTRSWEKRKKELETLFELYEVYRLYQKTLVEQQLYDYEDMIMFVIQTFRDNQDLLSQYQEQYLYIHVDEYQDTNGSQNELLELLCSFDSSPNIFVVGDDDQAIYRFQGANVENILGFNTAFKNVTIIPTEVNYRSTQIILDVADSLIQKNENRLTNQIDALSKKLSAHNKGESRLIDVYAFDSAESENVFIAKEIKRLYEEEHIPYSEIAVLFRKNAHATDIIDVLNRFNIPTQFQRAENIWLNQRVEQFIILLEAIQLHSELEDSLLYQLLLFDFVEINPVVMYKFAAFAKRRRFSYLQIITDETTWKEFYVTLSDALREKADVIQEFVSKLFIWHKEEINQAFPVFIESVLNGSGLLDYLKDNQELDDLRSIIKLFNYTVTSHTNNKDLDLSTFLRDVLLAKEQNVTLNISQLPSPEDAVVLSTAHGSKGLEFEYVFIAKASDSNWGKTRKQYALVPNTIYNEFVFEGDEKQLMLEDERRLFFVALTRAKQHVTITYALEYTTNGYSSAQIQSRFISDLDPTLIELHEKYEPISDEDTLTLISKPSDVDLTKQEEAYIKERIADLSLSASALNLYLMSPKQYLYLYIFNMPTVKTKELAMGTAVHKALEEYNKELLKGSMLSKQDFIDWYAKTLYREFYEYQDYENTLKEGKKLLEQFYEHVLSKHQYNIAATEYTFSGHAVMLDVPQGNPIRLTGRIDALEYIDKKNQTVQIIDYKTSAYKSANHIQGRTSGGSGNEWRQLVFYKLAADIDQYFRPQKNLSKQRFEVTHGEIVFVKPYKEDDYRTVELPIDKRDVDELKELIFEVVSRIRNLEFPEECDIKK